MKKVMGKVRQTLSILLAVAMVVTCVPQTGLSALAANETPEEITQEAEAVTAEADVTTPENDSEVTDDAEEEGNEGVIEEGGEEQAPAEDDAQVEEPVVDDEEPAEEVEVPTMSVLTEGDVHQVELPENPEGYTINGDSTATEGTDYTFTVTPKTGWTIDSVEYTIGSDEEAQEAEATAGGGTTYKISGSDITDDVTITVTASPEEHTITVTVGANVTVKYTVTGGEDQALTTGENDVSVAYGEAVTLTVTPDSDYDVVVKKNDVAVPAGTDGTYNLGTITEDITVTIETSKNKFSVDEDIATDDNGDVLAEIEYADGCVDSNNKIAKDTDLVFSLKAPDGVDWTNKKIEVSYQIGDDGEETPLTAVNEVYTIKAADITDDIKLVVGVRDYANYTVSLAEGSEHVTATYLSDDGYVAFPENGATALEDSEFEFKLEADKYFKITKVEVDGEELTDDEDVYSFTVTKNTEIVVTTELDPEQCYNLAFKLSDNSDDGSATIEVAVPDDDENEYGDINAANKSMVAGDTLTTRDDTVVVTVNPSEYYQIVAVKKDGEELTPDADIDEDEDEDAGDEEEDEGDIVSLAETAARYTIELTEAETVTIEVSTDPEGIEASKTVTINNTGAHLELDEVKADEADATETDGKYTLDAGTKRLNLVISATGAFRPVVKYGDDKVLHPSNITLGGKTQYTYSVLAASLDDDETITISEVEDTKQISVVGDTANVNVTASSNGRALAGSAPYEVSQGTTVTIRVEQKDNCTLTAVNYTVGTTDGTAKVTKGVAEFTVVVTDNTEIEVTAPGLYKAGDLVTAEGGEVTKDAKGVYSVSYDGSYKASLLQGASTTPVNVAEVKVFEGKNEVTEGVSIDLETATAPLITLSDAVNNKTLTLKLYVAGEEGADNVEAAAYTLKVSKVVSTITVPATAKQPTDTIRKYTVKTDGELAKLTVTPPESHDVISSAEIDVDGMLVITTGQIAGTAEVVVSSGEVSKTIAVTTTALVAGTAAPTAKYKSSTDVALTLTLGSKIEDAEAGGVLYEVQVTPQAGADKSANLIDEALTQYVVKDGASQDVTINVAKEGKGLGDGDAWSFDVVVTLVHTDDKNKEVTADTDAAVIIGRSVASKTLVAKTQTPAWETNLKLKKGTTTIYTGQTDVMIATPQFTKTTTYTQIDSVEDITNTGSAALTVEEKDGLIYATASSNTAVGKHTIQVIAGAHTDEDGYTMYASRATIVVTVVQGIDALAVSVPSYSLYKATGKAASLKATPIYNDDWTGKDKTVAPKTKKVTWEIVAADSDEAFDSKVTIKNGTVSVAKDYILKPTDEENQFRIKVSVDNGADNSKFIGAADAAYSDPITITNVGAQITTVAIVQPQYGEDWDITGYKVVAQPNAKNDKGKVDPTSVEATAINYGTVVAFRTAALKDTYTEEELAEATVPGTDLTFKSSKTKNVTVYSDGYVEVGSPAAGVKLTVTANDGSKNSGELSLNVGYDATSSDDLALQIWKADDIYGTVDWDNAQVVYSPSVGQPDTVETSYHGSAVSLLVIQVQQLNEEKGWYEEAPRYGNYTLKVKTGGKLTQNYSLYNATLDKRDIEITLTNNDTKTTYTYKLTNEDVLGSSAAKITAKAMNTLHPVGTAEDQKVTIQLSKVPELSDMTMSADVEVDWSKVNDKNRDDLNYFANVLSQSSYEITDYDAAKKTANITLDFNNDDNDEVRFNQSSYALKVTLRGTKTEEDETISSAYSVPAAVTVKVDKVKKFTFKPTASYTIGSKDGYAVLSGKSSIPSEDLILTFDGLLNANNKGKENNFTGTFKIGEGGKLMLRDGVDAATISKDDLTGYLVYSATTDKAYYDNKGARNQLAKITVKVSDKAVIKYTHDSAEINNVKDATATVQIKVNSKDAMVADNVEVAAAAIKTTKDPLEVSTSDGKVVLKLTDTTTKAKVSATLYIVPSDSAYLDKFVGEGVNPTDDDYKNYASTVNVTLTVKAPETPDKTEMTVEDAKAAVEAWVRDVKNAETAPDWLTAEYENDTAVKTALLSEVDNAVNATNVTIEVVDDENDNTDFVYTSATTDADGELKGTFKVTVDLPDEPDDGDNEGEETEDEDTEDEDKGENTGNEGDVSGTTLADVFEDESGDAGNVFTVAFDFTIPQIVEDAEEPEVPEEITISDELVEAIQSAVAAAIDDDENPIIITEDTEWDVIAEDILKAANDAEGMITGLEVVAAQKPFEIVEDEETNKKTATITLIIQQEKLLTNYKTVEISGIELTPETENSGSETGTPDGN